MSLVYFLEAFCLDFKPPFLCSSQCLARGLMRKPTVHLNLSTSSPNAFQPLCHHSETSVGFVLGFAGNSAFPVLRIGTAQGENGQRRQLSSLKFFFSSAVLCCLQADDYCILSGFSSWPIEVRALVNYFISPGSGSIVYFSTSIW